MNELTKEYINLIDEMLSNPKFENNAVFLTSVKRTILRKKSVTPSQINKIEMIHANNR